MDCYRDFLVSISVFIQIVCSEEKLIFLFSDLFTIRILAGIILLES